MRIYWTFLIIFRELIWLCVRCKRCYCNEAFCRKMWFLASYILLDENLIFWNLFAHLQGTPIHISKYEPALIQNNKRNLLTHTLTPLKKFNFRNLIVHMQDTLIHIPKDNFWDACFLCVKNVIFSNILPPLLKWNLKNLITHQQDISNDVSKVELANAYSCFVWVFLAKTTFLAFIDSRDIN